MKTIRLTILGAIALGLFGLMAWGATPSPLGGSNTSRGNLERIPDYNTIQPNAWYIAEDGGSDTGNSCLSPSSPCKTAQRVLTLISAKHLRHQQAIYAAPGNYPCVLLTGYQTDQGFSNAGTAGSISTASGAGITLIGTLADSTLDSGTASGTISSSVTGSASLGFILTVVNASSADAGTQFWTPHDLKGRFVSFGNFTRNVIYDNTATSFQVMAATAAPANGTTYHIQDSVSFLNTSCNIGPSVGIAVDGGFSAPLTNQGAFIVADNTPGLSSIQYRIQQFAFNNATGVDILLATPATVQAQDCQFQNPAQTAQNRISANVSSISFTCTRCAFRQSAASSFDNIVTLNQSKGILSLNNSLFENGGSAARIGGELRALLNTSAINPITSFGYNLFTSDAQVNQFLCEGNTAAVNACVRHGTLTNGDGVSHGQTIIQSATCRIGPSGGLCLDMQGPGVATIFVSEFASDAGLPSDSSTALIRELYGAGVNADLTTTFTASSANDIALFPQSSNGLFFQSTGIRGSVPPCATDAVGNWFCSPP